VEARPIMQQGRWTPWFYLAPALIILAIFVVYPTARTFIISFQNSDASATLLITACPANRVGGFSRTTTRF
jgi:ABC-type sugar transport system permease subunit